MSDFDGTIAPIVADPALAAADPRAVCALHRLATRLEAVAVVSGRPARFLVRALELAERRSPLRVYGIYGAEEALPDGSVRTLEGLAGRAEAVGLAVDELRSALAPPVEVEEKRLAAGVHWRKDPAAAEAAAVVARSVAERHDLVMRPGRMSVELLPVGAPDKGSVVRRLAAGSSVACCLGDDLGDVPAFDAVAELGRGGALRAFRVAVGSDELPDALLAAADLVLDGPAAATELLAELAARV